MTMRSLWAVTIFLLLRADPIIEVQNTGWDPVPERVFEIGGDLVAFSVREEPGVDLDGDGKDGSLVLHVYDVGMKITRNVGVAADIGTDSVRFLIVDGGQVAFVANEFKRGPAFTCNGNDFSRPLFGYNAVTGETTCLSNHSGYWKWDFFVSNGRVVYFVFEKGTDLNGDGDGEDTVWHVHDGAAGTTVNTGMASYRGTIEVAGDRVAFMAFEPHHGNTDLNGDGDAADSVLFVYDARTDSTTNTRLTSLTPGAFDGRWLVGLVDESVAGVDLTGDGDTTDRVAHSYDTETDTLFNIGVVSIPPSYVPTELRYDIDDGFIALLVPESNGDRNGDGDALDSVLHVFDTRSSTLRNTGVAATRFGMEGNGGAAFRPFHIDGRARRVAFAVSEIRQGNTDLNSDGDVDDYVLYVYDFATDTATNLGLAIDLLQVAGDAGGVAFSVSEQEQGVDLDGNGVLFSKVLFYYDTSAGTLVNVGMDAADLSVGDGSVAFLVREFRVGHIDLNGDGDTDDYVAHVYDSFENAVYNLRVSVSSHFEDGNKIVSKRNVALTASGGGVLHAATLPGNSPPFVDVRLPADLASFVRGEAVTFEGTVEDWQDGALAEGLVWQSSIDGEIGRGASFSTTSLSEGAHKIVAEVMDSGGLTGSDQINITVLPPKPLTLSLSINGLSPASKIVSTAGPVHLTLDISPGTVTSSLDWYYLYAVNNRLVWVTSAGLSVNPAPLGQGPPSEVHGLTLLNSLIPLDRRVAFLFFALDGSTLVSWDYIVADSSN